MYPWMIFAAIAHVRGERRGECTSCGFAPKRTDTKGDGAKAKRRERARRDFYRNASPRSFHPTKAFLDKWVREMYGWKNVKPSDVIIAKETCAEGIYYCVRKTVGNGDFFSVTSFGKR